MNAQQQATSSAGTGDEATAYRRMERVIAYIDRHHASRPGVAELARVAGLSVFHFSREFRRWAGLSPSRYMRRLALDIAKQELNSDSPVLAAAWAAGLSGGGRLHDLFVSFEAVTPGEYKAGGEGLTLRHGFAATPFGRMHAAMSDRGLVHLAFIDGAEPAALAALRRRWPQAQLERDDAAIGKLARQVFSERRGRIALRLRGTNFQVQVWRALVELGSRGPTSYSELAGAIGRPAASRAVGQAVGENPVAWLIPCHRVLRRDGSLGGYRWGAERKLAMLAWEYGQLAADA